MSNPTYVFYDINKDIDDLQEEGYSVYYISKKLDIDEGRIIAYSKYRSRQMNGEDDHSLEIHYERKRKELVYSLYEEGHSIKEISDMMGYACAYTDAIIRRKIEDDNPNVLDLYPIALDAPINVYKINEFKQNLKVGDKYEIHFSIETKDGIRTYMNDIVTVKKKYPFIVRTDKGDYQYVKLFAGTKISK